MTKRIISAVFAACLLAVPLTSMAKQTYDFSDIHEPYLQLPFTVTNVEVTGEWNTLKHIYHVTESYDKVIKKLADMYDKKQTLGDQIIMGLTKQTSIEMYQMIVGFQNEHHYAQITPEGSGTMITFEAAPVSYVSGVFDVAVYGFTMPDGTIISAISAAEE
ncbi:MAG: hypothetical protein J6A01_02505 [Proteobacteria bacterium]|nr:hypothetical protein [Pseudomonadota bacterium]